MPINFWSLFQILPVTCNRFSNALIGNTEAKFRTRTHTGHFTAHSQQLNPLNLLEPSLLGLAQLTLDNLHALDLGRRRRRRQGIYFIDIFPPTSLRSSTASTFAPTSWNTVVVVDFFSVFQNAIAGHRLGDLQL